MFWYFAKGKFLAKKMQLQSILRVAHSMYFRTVNFQPLLFALLDMFQLVYGPFGATCTRHSIQEGIKCTKSKELLRSHCLIYISTVLQKQFGTPILLGKIAFPVAQDISFYDQAFAIHIYLQVRRKRGCRSGRLMLQENRVKVHIF